MTWHKVMTIAVIAEMKSKYSCAHYDQPEFIYFTLIRENPSTDDCDGEVEGNTQLFRLEMQAIIGFLVVSSFLNVFLLQTTG